MLTLSRDREESPESVLDTLKIVPLIISYELDPCDALKSAELSAGSGYVKSEFEDITSIATGIVGQKGRVHLHFGTPLPAHLSVAETVAGIDRQMVAHYRLYQTNIWAWQWLYGTPLPCEIPYDKGTISEAAFRARFEAIPEEHQRWFLTMYANPVNRRLEVAEERAGNEFYRAREIKTAADNQHQCNDDYCGVPEAGKDLFCGDQSQQVGDEQRPKRHQIVAVATPDQKHEQRADQRKQHGLV